MKILHFISIFSMVFTGLACAGGATTSNQPKTEICDNDLDDDGDHMLDCFDPDCFSSPVCASGLEICNNGVDDDGDTLIDCADPQCASHAACTATPEICNNGLDDDGDGLTDCADPSCASNVLCQTGTEICTNGADDDGDGAIDCADLDCAGNAACQVTAENCTNGADDDGDGAIDCADSDCAGNAACANTGTCTEDNIYVGAPAGSCTAGNQCGITYQNPNYFPQCRASSTFAGGSNYGACGNGGMCPFGSLCDATYGCMPFCDAVNATPTFSCPGSGICLYTFTTTNNRTIGLCKGVDNCDVVANNCSGKTCVLLVDGNVCVLSGGAGEGSTCTYADDCGAGLICVGTCMRACYLSSADPCDWLTEDCYQLNDANGNPIPTYGVCDSIF